MIQYLINFVLCSGLFLIVYHLFLQSERMYRFNRFYLLFSLVFSLGVSFITITTKTRIVPATEQQSIQQIADYQSFDNVVSEPSQAVTAVPAVQQVNYLPILLAGFYGLVALVLLTRFAVNLYRIRREIKENQVVDYQQTQLILTNADVTPHSFLNYIFVNRNDHDGGDIAPEIILHEQTHVRQLHSLDVMLIELIQAIFWFNPFIPFYRKAIQLNHEFLADEAVIEKYDNTPDYQYLLLAKVGQAHGLQLTSQFNYLTTKKRLIMMTKTTSAKMAWGKKLLIVPVVAGAVLLFSQKIEASILPATATGTQPKVDEMPNTKPDTIKKKQLPGPPRLKEAYRPNYADTDAPQSVMDEYAGYVKKYNMLAKKYRWNVTAEDKTKMNNLFTQMSKRQQDEQRVGFGRSLGMPLPKRAVTLAQLKKWAGNKNYKIYIDVNKISSKELAKYSPEDFDRFWIAYSGVQEREHEHVKFHLYLETKAYYAASYKQAMADRSDFMWISPTNHMFVDAKK